MRFAKCRNGYLVRCDIGEELVGALVRFASENNIASGAVTGLVAVRNPVLGYFDPGSKEYLKKEFQGTFELLNLTGNFARLDSNIILHGHATISDAGFNVFGGHLFSCEIAVTGEFYIFPGDVEILRGPDKATGLNLLKL
jgi:predicted DNA-binding protein with PD1-like motif